MTLIKKQTLEISRPQMNLTSFAFKLQRENVLILFTQQLYIFSFTTLKAKTHQTQNGRERRFCSVP